MELVICNRPSFMYISNVKKKYRELFEVRKIRTNWGSQQVEHLQVRNMIRSGVWRSVCPLPACHGRCKCSSEKPLEFGKKVSSSTKSSKSAKFYGRLLLILSVLKASKFSM